LEAIPHKQKKEIILLNVGVKRAMGKTSGINLEIAIWIYKIILVPQILYASMVWWPMVSRVEARSLLQSLTEGCCTVYYNNNHRGAESNPLFNSNGPGCHWSC